MYSTLRVLLNYILALWDKRWFRITAFYGIAVFFLIIDAYLILKKDSLAFAALPLVLAIVLMALYASDKLIWIIVAFTPLSLPLKNFIPSLPIDMYLPTEPLMVLLVLLLIIGLSQGKKLDRDFLRHPVSLTIYFNLLWIFITSFTSEIPVVSFKFIISRLWFLIPFYFMMNLVLKQNQKNYRRFVFTYAIAMLPVMGYAFSRHLSYGLWYKNAAHFVMHPFFNDHTSYGAVIAMFIPFLFTFSLSKKFGKTTRLFIGGLLFIFLVTEVFSYSRAAWLSLIVALGVWTMIKLRIKFRTVAITLITLVGLYFAFQNQILMKLEQNSTDSSNNLMDHVTSMSNISTDASNMERINRWKCVFKMFEQRPVLGWGPGTYAMLYGPYQVSSDRTIISTNSGDMGNAHSEYLGPLAEMGIIGMLSKILIFIVVIYTAIQTYIRSKDPDVRSLVLAALLGLITYYFHGLMNNFLDTDKASVPFWTFTAMIVTLDIASKKKETMAGETNSLTK